MKRIIALGFALAVFTLPLISNAAERVRTVRVARQVEVPREMLFGGLSERMTAGVASGAGGPVVGGLATGRLAQGSEDVFRIGESVRKVMANELQRSGKVTVKESGPVDAELRLRVIGYGFYSSGMFARRLRPLVGFEAQLVRNDGSIAWKHRCSVTSMNHETPALLPEEIGSNPKLGIEALRKAAEICARKAVTTLK